MKPPTVVLAYRCALSRLWGYTLAAFDFLPGLRAAQSTNTIAATRTYKIMSYLTMSFIPERPHGGQEQSPGNPFGPLGLRTVAAVSPQLNQRGPVPRSIRTGPELALDSDAVRPGKSVPGRRHLRPNRALYRQNAPCLNHRPLGCSWCRNLWSLC